MQSAFFSPSNAVPGFFPPFPLKVHGNTIAQTSVMGEGVRWGESKPSGVVLITCDMIQIARYKKLANKHSALHVIPKIASLTSWLPEPPTTFCSGDIQSFLFLGLVCEVFYWWCIQVPNPKSQVTSQVLDQILDSCLSPESWFKSS